MRPLFPFLAGESEATFGHSTAGAIAVPYVRGHAITGQSTVAAAAGGKWENVERGEPYS